MAIARLPLSVRPNSGPRSVVTTLNRRLCAEDRALDRAEHWVLSQGGMP